ncbi:MAG TPA: glycosyltransferase [Chitinophagaceae bacterium]|nr:glycosyltransferase [Chitinophagaceae bacterium]
MATFLFYDDKIINILVPEEKPSGGAAVQAYGWVRGLMEAGQQVYIMTNVSAGGTLKDSCNDLQLVPMYDPKKGVRWVRWFYYRLPYLYSKIKQLKPDYLYQGIPCWQSFVLGVICRQLHISFILRISNDSLLDDRFFNRNSKGHKFLQRAGMKLADYILCQNNYQFDIVRKEFPSKKVIKISNPVFINNNLPVVAATERKYIAWLGLYQYQKNLKGLYEIATLLKHEQFRVAGKEAAHYDEETLYYIRKLGQLSNVKFVGFLSRQQVLPFLANATFLLNTSHYEGFSNTFLEAMTVGTPIMTSEKVNPDSIITKHKLGLVYSSPTNLQKQYVELLPERYNELSENVLQYVEQQHGYKPLANKLLSILNSVESATGVLELT